MSKSKIVGKEEKFLSDTINEPINLDNELKLAKHLEVEDLYVKHLIKGGKFLKFGRSGKPHWKYIYCDIDGTIFWADTEELNSDVNNLKLSHKFNIDSSITLLKSTRVESGKKTDVFKRSVAAEYNELNCFSIICTDRTLDLYVNDKSRDFWVAAFAYAQKNVRLAGSIGLLSKRIENVVDKPSDVVLSGMLDSSAKQYGEDHMPKVVLHPPVNLRTRDNTDRKMYGLETPEEQSKEIAAFKKEIESKTRREQLSWDVCCVFKVGSSSIVTLPRTMLAKDLPISKAEALKKKEKEKKKNLKVPPSKKAKQESWFFANSLDEEEEAELENQRQNIGGYHDDASRYNSEEDSHSDTSRAVKSRFHASKKKKNQYQSESEEEEDSDENYKPKPKSRLQILSSRRRAIEEEDDGEDEEEEDLPPKVKLSEDEGIGDMVDLAESELFMRATAQLIKSFQAAGLKTCVYSVSDPERIVCLIGATEERLEEEAARIAYEIELDNTACLNNGIERAMPLAYHTKLQGNVANWGTLFGPFLRYTSSKAHHHTLYRRFSEPPFHISSFFQSADRVKLINSIIECDMKLGGSGAPIKHYECHPHHSLKDYFPLDSKLKRNELYTNWVSWRSLASLGLSTLVSPPLDSIRNYFGEHIAMYVAFVSFMCMWLAIPSLVGIIVWLYQAIVDVVGDAPWAIFFGLFVAGFSTVFVEFWKRYQTEYKAEWGLFKSNDKDVVLPSYMGTWEMSDVDGRHTRVFLWYQRLPYFIFSYTVLAMCCVAVAFTVVGLLIFRNKMVVELGINAGYYFSCLNAIQILIFNVVFNLIAKKLTELENHKYQRDFDTALLIKTVIFKFINSYLSLFYMAFFQGVWGWMERCYEDECLRNVRQHLGFLVVTQILFSQVLNYFVPWIANMFQKCQSALTSVNFSFGGTEVENQLRRYRNAAVFEASEWEDEGGFVDEPAEMQSERITHDVVNDMDNLLIQYGYATMFAIAFPLAPAILLISNLVGIRTFARRICRMYRRPNFQSVNIFGRYLLLFRIFSAIAIVTNLAIVIFSTSFFHVYIKASFDWQLICFISVEHVLLLVMFLLIFCISEVPRKIKYKLARQKVIVNVLLLDQLESRDLASLPFVAPPEAARMDISKLSTDPIELAGKMSQYYEGHQIEEDDDEYV